jgi:hypothetical protein
VRRPAKQARRHRGGRAPTYLSYAAVAASQVGVGSDDAQFLAATAIMAAPLLAVTFLFFAPA